MQLKLKNMGIIKEADVTIDGLTVIAGENDTGKSTLSKALFFGLTIMKRVSLNKSSMKDTSDILTVTRIFDVDILNGVNVEYLNDVDISINIENININPKLGLGVSFNEIYTNVNQLKQIPDIICIETPTIWNFLETFRNTTQISQQMGIRVNHPYIMNDLAIKLSNARLKGKKTDISDKTKEIMGGEFKKDDKDIFYYEKDKKRMELINTATGIKSFGILQVLTDNGWLFDGNILILDEPEVHLHPKWQLKMAEIIVELIKNGVKVVVNSHSPYMIEALQKYSELEKINADFYLAEDGVIGKVDDSNSKTLSKIFSKLSEPFDVFDEMESERFQNG